MRSTVSPSTMRNSSPADNSVRNISVKAIEYQAASTCPETFWNPSTATDLR